MGGRSAGSAASFQAVCGGFKRSCFIGVKDQRRFFKMAESFVEPGFDGSFLPPGDQGERRASSERLGMIGVRQGAQGLVRHSLGLFEVTCIEKRSGQGALRDRDLEFVRVRLHFRQAREFAVIGQCVRGPAVRWCLAARFWTNFRGMAVPGPRGPEGPPRLSATRPSRHSISARNEPVATSARPSCECARARSRGWLRLLIRRSSAERRSARAIRAAARRVCSIKWRSMVPFIRALRHARTNPRGTCRASQPPASVIRSSSGKPIRRARLWNSEMLRTAGTARTMVRMSPGRERRLGSQKSSGIAGQCNIWPITRKIDQSYRVSVVFWVPHESLRLYSNITGRFPPVR